METQEQPQTSMIKRSAKDALAARIKEANERENQQQKELKEQDRHYRIRKRTEIRVARHREAFERLADAWFPISVRDLPKEEQRELEILVHRKALQRLAGWGLLNLSAIAATVTLWQFTSIQTNFGVSMGFLTFAIPTASIFFSCNKYERKNYVTRRFRLKYHINFLLGRKYGIAAAKEAARTEEDNERARAIFYANSSNIDQTH